MVNERTHRVIPTTARENGSENAQPGLRGGRPIERYGRPIAAHPPPPLPAHRVIPPPGPAGPQAGSAAAPPDHATAPPPDHATAPPPDHAAAASAATGRPTLDPPRRSAGPAGAADRARGPRGRPSGRRRAAG